MPHIDHGAFLIIVVHESVRKRHALVGDLID